MLFLEPFKAFKEFPDSAPYVGAFASRTEQILVPAVHRIKAKAGLIMERLSGEAAPLSISGDFAFVVRPLPKIFLGYIFYEADEDFPPSVTCLYSSNADRFMPMDGLADVGEYTSKTILAMVDTYHVKVLDRISFDLNRKVTKRDENDTTNGL
jgi:hypothetical protein